MGYSVKQIGVEPIVIVTYLAPFNAETDIPPANREAKELLENIPGVLYRVVDLTPAHLSFSAVVEGLSVSSRSQSGGIADPRFRSIFVGPDDLTQLTASAYKQNQYGAVDVPWFSSVEDGVAYARAELAKA